jgi:uncharacterized membrane protein
VKGYCHTQGKDIPFIGTSKNKNLNFIGLNIVYYLQITRDEEIKKMIESIMGMDENIIPDRTIVPINIKTENNQITINSSYDNVNTTLSSIDIFHGEREFTTQNNLIVVNAGKTVIKIRYPHIVTGMVVSLMGVIVTMFIYKVLKKKEMDENETKESS